MSASDSGILDKQKCHRNMNANRPSLATWKRNKMGSARNERDPSCRTSKEMQQTPRRRRKSEPQWSANVAQDQIQRCPQAYQANTERNTTVSVDSGQEEPGCRSWWRVEVSWCGRVPKRMDQLTNGPPGGFGLASDVARPPFGGTPVLAL